MKASSFIFRLGILVLIVSSFFSCKKDLSTIGLDMVDPSELIRMGYSDTLQVDAFSIGEDSVKTANLSYAIVGSMNDAVFGKTQASFFTQLRLSAEPSDFGTGMVCDSAFLILPYTSGYGDTMSNTTFRVYELSEPILDSVHTYSNKTITYGSSPIGQLTFTPRPHDSTYYNGAMQSPAIRIPLNEQFGARMAEADTNILATNDDFLDFFHGIAVVADKQTGINQGCMLRFNLTTGKSRIVMYYHNSTDTTSYTFLINTDCQRFNSYQHDNYSGASQVLQQEIGGDTLMGDQFLFMQAMGGIRVKLKFPTLKNWTNKEHVLINDAQLIMTNAIPSTVFTPPSGLVLYPVNSDGSLYPYQLPDASESAIDHDGAYYSADNTYRFRIPRYVQQVLNGNQTDYGLYMLIPGSSIVSDRVVLYGPGSPTSAMKLYIRYTVVN